MYSKRITITLRGFSIDLFNYVYCLFWAQGHLERKSFARKISKSLSLQIYRTYNECVFNHEYMKFILFLNKPTMLLIFFIFL